MKAACTSIKRLYASNLVRYFTTEWVEEHCKSILFLGRLEHIDEDLEAFRKLMSQGPEQTCKEEESSFRRRARTDDERRRGRTDDERRRDSTDDERRRAGTDDERRLASTDYERRRARTDDEELSSDKFRPGNKARRKQHWSEATKRGEKRYEHRSSNPDDVPLTPPATRAIMRYLKDEYEVLRAFERCGVLSKATFEDYRQYNG